MFLSPFIGPKIKKTIFVYYFVYYVGSIEMKKILHGIRNFSHFFRKKHKKTCQAS